MNATTTTEPATGPQFAVAGTFLEALAARDLPRLAATLDDDASLSALLPRGFREFQGPGEISAAFDQWFGDATEFEVIDAAVGHVSSRLQLRWRIHVRSPRFANQPMVVEQQVYADTNAAGRIHHMSLLCSGFCKENENVCFL